MTSKLDTALLDGILGGMDRRCDDILSTTAHEVKGLAKAHAPRDTARPPKKELSSKFLSGGNKGKKRPADITGNLRAGIEAEMVTFGRLWQVHDSVEYGIYQEQVPGFQEFLIYTTGFGMEMGGHNIPARPFMSPAVEKARKNFEKRWAELFR